MAPWRWATKISQLRPTSIFERAEDATKAMRLPSGDTRARGAAGALRDQVFQELVDRRVGERAQLVIAAVLDRVRDEHARGRKAERLGLRRRGVDELGRRDE